MEDKLELAMNVAFGLIAVLVIGSMIALMIYGCVNRVII